MKFYDDLGDGIYSYGNEHGIALIISAHSLDSAYDIAIDESHPIDADDIPEAYGFYLNVLIYHKKRHVMKWVICSDDHGKIPNEEITARIGGRKIIGGLFDDVNSARKYCLEYIAENEIDLQEGYRYQSNFTGTGIVCTGHNEWIREATDQETALFREWRLRNDDSYKLVHIAGKPQLTFAAKIVGNWNGHNVIETDQAGYLKLIAALKLDGDDENYKDYMDIKPDCAGIYSVPCGLSIEDA